MKIQIIDTNHIMLVASNAESAEYSNHTRILVDNKDSFVCNSEPSSSAFIIERPIGGSLFNIPLDITNSPFTTDELLIVYLELDDLTYPYVIPCYDNEKLMHHIANKVGIIGVDCICLKELNKAYPANNGEMYLFKPTEENIEESKKWLLDSITLEKRQH